MEADFLPEKQIKNLQRRITQKMLISNQKMVMDALKIGKQVRAESERLLRIADALIFWITMAVVLLTGGIAFFVGRRITSSMNNLQQATKTVGAGNLDSRLTGLGNDEIGDLGRAFNRMTDKLKQNAVDLDQQLKAMQNTEESLKKLSTTISTNTHTNTDL